MKKGIIKSIFNSIVLFTVVLISGCTKNDGPIKKDILEGIDAIPVIATTIDPTGSQAIDMLSLGNFQGKFVVSEFFSGPGTESPAKVDIVVRKNGGVGTTVKVFKANVTTLPTTFNVTAAEIAALFGAPIVLGDNYDFSVDIYLKNGRKYEAFPQGGIATSTGPTAVPGYSYSARYGAICAYDPAIYEGDFEVVSDAFEDFSPGEIIKLTKVSASSFSYIDPYAVAATPVPIIVNVNTLNNNVSIAKTSIGTKWVWTSTYTGAFVQTGGSAASSFVAPCDKEVRLNITYSVDQGGLGTYLLVMKKKA